MIKSLDAHKVFAVIGLIVLSGCGARLAAAILPNASADAEGSIGYRIVAALVYLTATACLLRRPSQLIETIGRNSFLFALFFFAVCSILWSPDADLTLRRIIALTGVMFFATYFAHQFDETESIKLLLIALGIVAVLSFITIIVKPNVGTHGGSHLGRWRGLYFHKNDFGREMALAAFLFLCYAPRDWRKLITFGFAVLCIIMVAFSGSAQGQALVGATLIAFFVLRQFFAFDTFLLSGFLVLSIVGAILLVPIMGMVLPIFYEALGRDATLTGRSEIWAAAIDFTIANNPATGYGFTGDLYVDESGEAAALGHAHNGYIQLFSELGFIGIFLFAFASLGFFKNLLINAIIIRSAFTQLMFTFALYFYALSYVASPILATNDLIWALFVFFAIKASAHNYSVAHQLEGTTRNSTRQMPASLG